MIRGLGLAAQAAQIETEHHNHGGPHAVHKGFAYVDVLNGNEHRRIFLDLVADGGLEVPG